MATYVRATRALRVLKKQRLVWRSRESGSAEWLTRKHADTKRAGSWVLKPGFMPTRFWIERSLPPDAGIWGRNSLKPCVTSTRS